MRGMDFPRILLIDDHSMFRTGLRMVIGMGMPDAEILEAGSSEAALQEAPARVDLILLDIKLNGLSGLASIPLCRQRWPSAPVVMLSSEDDPDTVNEALQRGAAGFVSKSDTAVAILDTVRSILSGQAPVTKSAPDADTPRLTPRQCEVLTLLHQGLSNKQIARKLYLSDNTVRRHVQDILTFFDVANRAEAVFVARRQGIIN